MTERNKNEADRTIVIANGIRAQQNVVERRIIFLQNGTDILKNDMHTFSVTQYAHCELRYITQKCLLTL